MAPCFEDVPGRPDESMARNANVTKAVHVQAAIGSRDPVKETEWLQEAADRTGFPHGIVAYADLRDPSVEEVLVFSQNAESLYDV